MTPEEKRDAVYRLREIQSEMLELLNEIRGIVEDFNECDHAEAYVLAHLRISLTSDHGYLDRSDNLDKMIASCEEEVNELMGAKVFPGVE